MNARGRDVLWFAGRFLLVFAVCLWLYPKVLPLYERVVLGAANQWLRAVSSPMMLGHHPQGHITGAVLRPDGQLQNVPVGTSYRPEAAFAQLPLFAALLLATPMKPRSLLLRGLLGLLLVFSLHVLATLVVFHARHGLQVDPHSLWSAWLGALALTSGQIGVFGIWALLTWSYWIGSYWIGVKSRHST